MYPGMVNSPVTMVFVDINSSQNTITVTDGSRLPDAPNLATIGSEENAETILYSGKSGNNLTGVTRGFQGVARSWSAGTPIGRMFTAYDYDTLRTNLTPLISHAHGNISNSGAIGSTPNLPVITGAAGQLVAGSFGVAAGTFCQGNDARLNDSRTPLAHNHDTGAINTGILEAVRGGTGIGSYTTGNYLRALNASTLEQRTPAQMRTDLAVYSTAQIDTMVGGVSANKRLYIGDETERAWTSTSAGTVKNHRVINAPTLGFRINRIHVLAELRVSGASTGTLQLIINGGLALTLTTTSLSYVLLQGSTALLGWAADSVHLIEVRLINSVGHQTLNRAYECYVELIP